MKITASHILKTYWDKNIPVNVFAIAQKMGINIQEKALQDQLLGCITRDPNNDFSVEIVINSTSPEDSKGFITALLLGYYFSSQKFQESIKEKVGTVKLDALKRFYRNEINNPIEAFANKFAIELVTPLSAIEYMLNNNKIENMADLHRIFHVPAAIMNIRINSL